MTLSDAPVPVITDAHAIAVALAGVDAAHTKVEAAMRDLESAYEPLWLLAQGLIARAMLTDWTTDGTVSNDLWSRVRIWPLEYLLPQADAMGIDPEVVYSLVDTAENQFRLARP